MASTFYTVAITAISGTSPGDGFIDPKTVEQYMADGESVATYDEAVAKERANLRYVYLISQLQLLGNAYLTNVEATNAGVATAPSALSFSVEYEHGDDYLTLADSENEGETLTGVDAVKRAIANALMNGEASRMSYIYDPALAREDALNPVGIRTEAIEIGALTDDLATAEAAVTVTKLV